MKPSPYTRFSTEKLILRDVLAIDRTILANERTLLAYIRSAVAVFLTGLSLVYVLDAEIKYYVAAVCVALSIVTLFIGFFRYYRMKRQYSKFVHRAGGDAILDNTVGEIE